MTEQIDAPGEPGSAALALVNSWHASRGGDVDEIGTPADARRWLVDRRLMARAARLSAADLDALHSLRAAVRHLVEARIQGSVGKRAHVQTVNAALAAARVSAVLVWPRTTPPQVERRVSAANPAEQALALIAADAMDLVTGRRGDSLIPCAADGCVRLLVRDHGRRRWCSTRCGDRVRAARHYAKTRATADRQRPS